MPWIHVADHGGATVTVLSLAEVVADLDQVGRVVDGPGPSEPLTGAATRRLLQGIAQAAAAEGVAASAWVGEHPDRWRLFDESHPFGQNPAMRRHMTAATAKPAVQLSHFNAKAGPVFLDHEHLYAGTRFTPAEAMRLLLVRQAFGSAGIQPFPSSIFDSGSGKASVCWQRPYLQVETGAGLAADLVANTVPGPAGTFNFGWPEGHRPGRDRIPTGQVDLLTWPSRSLILVPDSDGLVAGVAYSNGCPIPEDALTSELLPHTVYTESGTVVRPSLEQARVLRQILAAWATPAPAGLLGKLKVMPARDREGWTLRWSGIASDFKARIDGAPEYVLGVPACPDGDIATFLEATTAAYKLALRRIGDAGRDGWELGRPDITARIKTAVEPVLDKAIVCAAQALAAGLTTGHQAGEQVMDTATTATRAAVEPYLATRRRRPTALSSLASPPSASVPAAASVQSDQSARSPL